MQKDGITGSSPIHSEELRGMHVSLRHMSCINRLAVVQNTAKPADVTLCVFRCPYSVPRRVGSASSVRKVRLSRATPVTGP